MKDRIATKLDTRKRIELAEGVEVNLRVAGPFVRGWAFVIDLLIRALILTVGSTIIVFTGLMTSFQVSEGVNLLLAFLVMWFYMVLFEAGRRGATPGKRAMKLRVVQPSGAPITFGQAVVRNLLRFADFMPLLRVADAVIIPTYGFGLLTCLLTARFQRLGDLTANTVVVYDQPFRVPGMQVNEETDSALMPPLPLSREEEAAIVSFTERAALWSDDRKAELSDQLQELTGEAGMKGVKKLRRMGLWLQAEQ